MKIWCDDVKKEDTKKSSVWSACLGLFFLLLCGLIATEPKAAIIACGVLDVLAVVMLVIYGIRLRKM